MFKKIGLIFFGLVTLINASSKCPDIQDLKQHNGHYYGITTNTMTFDEAKKFAESKGGYIAIPNNAAENTFLKNILGGRKGGWIGVYDPSYSSSYSYSVGQKKNSSRFRDIKGNALAYSYWESSQPDNLIEEYDTYNAQQRVSPLGEHWVAMDGNSGKWWDYGNHLGTGNAKYYALLEFDEEPYCFEDLSSDVNDTLVNKKCSTQIWDDILGNLVVGNIFDCRTDVYGNTYCPSALSQCAQEWDYENGMSIKNTGNYIEYASKITVVDEKDPTSYMSCSKGKYDPSTGQCIYGGLYQITLNKNPEPDAYIYWKNNFSNPPTFFNIKAFVNSARINRETYICGYNVEDERSVEVISAYVWYLGRCPESDVYTYWYNDINWSLQTFMDGATQECSARGACPYTPPLIETSPANLVNECAVGYKYDSFINKCVGNLKQCPDGYTETVGNDKLFGECKRTKEYNYYNYICSGQKSDQGYNFKPIFTGGDCNPKSSSDLIDTNSDGLVDSCNSSSPPINNCKREKFLCQANENRPCSYVDNKWQCSPFPCFGEKDIIPEGDVEGANDKNNDGWNENGMCDGQIYIFNGKDRRCRSSDTFFGLAGGGCCDKDKVFMGLIECKENEKLLAKQNKAELCTEIGEYCSKKVKLGFAKICVQKSKGHCCFGSKLARFVHEQGRSQIGIEWGSPESPQCRGFTPEEFQKLDFSKIDLTGAFDMPEINQTDLTNKINNTVENFKNMVSSGNN